ncbi:MAG: hypothetical protein ACXU7H_04340 [Burkholderiaceae bacterium]
MKNGQDFRGVKFSGGGWSISSMSAENVYYLSRVLSQAIAYIPTFSDEKVNIEIGDLAGAEMVVVRSAEVKEDDLVLELHDVAADKSFVVTLSRQASKKHVLTPGTVVKVRSVSSGFVLQLGGQTRPNESQKNGFSNSAS